MLYKKTLGQLYILSLNKKADSFLLCNCQTKSFFCKEFLSCVYKNEDTVTSYTHLNTTGCLGHEIKKEYENENFFYNVDC